MKSYSDELPNVDKDKLETISQQIVTTSLIVNSIAFDVSVSKTSSAVAAAFSVLATLISIVTLVVVLMHRVPIHHQ